MVTEKTFKLELSTFVIAFENVDKYFCSYIFFFIGGGGGRGGCRIEINCTSGPQYCDGPHIGN